MADFFPVEIIFKIFVAVVLLVYWMVAFITIYHLTRFGIGTQPKKLSAIFLLGSIALTLAVVTLSLNVDLTGLIPR